MLARLATLACIGAALSLIAPARDLLAAEVQGTREAPALTRVVVAYLAGPRAKLNTLLAYNFLLSERRSLVLSGELVDGAGFWDELVKRKAWPDDMKPDERLRTALRSPTDDRYFLPSVSVAAFETVRRVPLLVPTGTTAIPEDQERRLCARHGWDAGEARCIIGLVPQSGIYDLRKIRELNDSSDDGERREVLFRQRAYALTVTRPLQHSHADSLEKDLRAHLIGRDALPQDISFAPALRALESRAFGTTDITDPCTEAKKLQGLVERAQRLSRWPATYRPKIDRTRLVIVDKGSPGLSKQQFIDPDSIDPDVNDARDILYVQHPYVFRSALQRHDGDCRKIQSASTAVDTLGHAVAVASVAFGARTPILANRVDTGFWVSGYLDPGALAYTVPNALATTMAAVANGSQQVIVASIDGEISPGSVGPVKEKVEAPFSITALGGAIFIAAPVRTDNQADYEPIGRVPDWGNGVTPCTEWPACLGATPFALVVAALDGEGKILEREPGTNKPYRLGSSIVGIAAPGFEIPVAHLANDQAMLTIRSGTSVAAPGAAALAMALQMSSTPGGALNLLARIAATSDLTLHFNNRLRFGVMNAQRAVLGNGGADKESVLLPWSDNETEDAFAASPLSGKITGQRYVNICSRDAAPLGRLPFFRQGQAYRGTAAMVECVSVKNLLRIRRTGQDGDGNPTFTIVHYVSGGDGFRNLLYPKVERDVLLRSQDGLFYCDYRAGRVDGSNQQRSCLVRTASDGTVSPVDLFAYDIVVSAHQHLQQ